MRKVVFAINITLDGCCDHTKMRPDEGMMAYYINLLREADVQVYGRKTYELMVPYWPDIAKSQAETSAENEFAREFQALKRVVFSKTLKGPIGDDDAKIVRGELREEILKLKEEAGKSILVGGVDLASQLMKLGLIDEYRFVVHPVLVGEGRRLLDGANLQQSLRLKLVETKAFASGCVALHYQKQ